MDNVVQYIHQYDSKLQSQLFMLRELILKTVPDVEEKISWGVPTYHYHGFLVQFAVNKHHLGFYCSPQTINHFQKELSIYSTNNKNTIRFPLHHKLPLDLIQKMILYRMEENQKDTHH